MNESLADRWSALQAECNNALKGAGDALTAAVAGIPPVSDFQKSYIKQQALSVAGVGTGHRLEEEGGVPAGEAPRGLSVFRDRATFGGRVSGPPVGRGAARRIVIEPIDDRSVRARDPLLAASRGFLLVFVDGRYWVELEIEAAAVEAPPR